MTTSTFQPRSCEPDAWRRWVREALTLTLRGWGSLLPLQAMVVGLGCAVLVFWVSSTVSFFSFAIMAVALMAPLFALQMSSMGLLAQGDSSLTGLMKGLMNDIQAHGKAYLQAAVVRVIVAVAVIGCFALMYNLGSKTGAPPPSDAPQKLMHPFFAALQIWSFLWVVTQAWRLTGWTGFYPQLAWQRGLPAMEALRLNRQAVQKNTHAIMMLHTLWVPMIFIAFLIPFAPLLLEPFWAGVVRAAYADIFDDQPGLKTVQKVTNTAEPTDAVLA